MESKYQIVIGLEVHVHLKTDTKLFCRCKNESGGEPNSRICPVCTGQPGTLPVINKKAVEQALRAACALQSTINTESVFERKQYFYPDLPKNYQISQYKQPLAEGGHVRLGSSRLKPLAKTGVVEFENLIHITRVHMEEDAGKLIHESDVSLVDYNRTGAPLMEIVSDHYIYDNEKVRPNIESPEQAAEYLKAIRQILRYCGVSDCDMEKGSMRCDANISLRKEGEELGVKTEIKNMNSFKAVEKALEYEAKRQEKILSKGEEIIHETRLWDENRGKTFSMRSKEESPEYRYFPEPDLPVLVIEDEWKEEIKKEIKKIELPAARKEHYRREYLLSDYDAEVLTQEKQVADYFDEAVRGLKIDKRGSVKKLTNWITVELLGKINTEGIVFPDQPVKPLYIAELVELIEEGVISGKMGKEIFEMMWNTKKSPSEIVKEKGMKQITSDDKIEEICQKVIGDNPDIVEKYKSGKEGVIGALVGSVMKATRGQANPQLVNEKLRELLC